MTIRLDRLREIGWQCWDPISLAFDGSRGGLPVDEYDSYLLEAASRIRSGGTDQNVAEYLANIEIEHIGLGEQQGAFDRAIKTASEIRRYLATLPAGSLKLR